MRLTALLLGLMAFFTSGPTKADCLERDIFGDCLKFQTTGRNPSSLTLSGRELRREGTDERDLAYGKRATEAKGPLILGYGLKETRIVRRP